MGVYGDPPGGAPLLIGNSKTLLIPAGVTELYLGTVDAFAGGPHGGYAGTYNDNVGGWNVSVVPETSTWAMMLVGFAGLGFAGYRKSRKTLSIAA